MKKVVVFLTLVVVLMGTGVFLAGCAQNTGSCESCKKAHPEYFQHEDPWVEQK